MGTKASQESLDLFRLFDAYYYEAIRVQKAHASDINILIGMEIDWIRPSSQTFITALLEKYPFNLFIGSVHHVHTIPIDYDHKLYVQARDKSGGTDAQLAEDYFDAQYEMLKALKPPIIGHFDLIRLKSDNQEASFTLWEGVWQRILRNLKFIAEYGGILELNSAAMRKGMSEPYPKAEICKVFLDLSGQFTLSDDSHGVDQVGANYGRVLGFAEDIGIRDMVYFEQGRLSRDVRFPGVSTRAVSLIDVKKHGFFT
ncbi:histidinolphosphatase [Toensbergia leucococca]|nr:histidinolphosphatase [Toensbergia leucococca]